MACLNNERSTDLGSSRQCAMVYRSLIELKWSARNIPNCVEASSKRVGPERSWVNSLCNA